MKYLYLLIIVILGYLIAYKINNKKYLPYLLLFSGAYLLSTIFSEIIFESYENIGIDAAYFILIGLLVQFIIDSLSKGIEHGHEIKTSNIKEQSSFIILIGLCLHSIFEGLSIYFINQTAFVAIIIHKLVISIVFFILIISSNPSLKKLLIYLSLFAISPFVGLIFEKYISYFNIEYNINAIIGGMFISVSTNIISEASKQHKFKLKNIIIIIFGFFINIILGFLN